MANALLVVDVQQFYLPDIPADLVQNIVNHQQALQYDVVAFSVFQNNPESNFTKSLKWTKCDTAEDAQLPKELQQFARDDNVFKRATYSAFNTTALHEYLQQHNVDRLVICGVDTDACVLATAFDAFDLGYHPKIEFKLTHSGNNLQQAAEDIFKKNLESRD